MENEKIEKKKKKFDIKIIKENSIYKMLSKSFSTVIFCCILMYINLLVAQIGFLVSSNILNILMFFISILGFLVLKDDSNKKTKVNSILFKILILFGMIVLINGFIVDIGTKVDNEVLKKGVKTIIYLFDIGLLIASIGLFTNEKINEAVNLIISEPFLDKFFKKEEEIHEGDAVLGYQVIDGVKSDIPVILPLKDRFLHMLILGPTGCGKTSQSIIPMINRDMQCPNLGITVLEPKGDLAEKVYAMAKYYGREVVYFNPILPDCPYFNPFHGKESDVEENLATTFNMLNPDSPQFFKDMSENLIRKSTKLLKRLYGNDATLLDLNTLVWDTNGHGKKMVLEFSKLKVSNPEVSRENEEVYSWFLNEYFAGMGGGKGPKTFEHCSGVRSQIAKLTSNKYLRKVLNPPKGHGSDLDFDDAFERGIVITMGTAQGALRDLGRYLGYFIILQLQASVFRRPGNENTRTHNMLYIDEFQVYSNPGFADMLTMGRSYRVASHLATQARAQIGMGGGRDGKDFIELVSTNARNKIVYPGVSSADAKYYSEEFGEILQVTKSNTYARQRFFSTLTDERVSTAVKEEMKVRFSTTDIIYKPFGQITYCIIKNNTIQPPGVSQIEFIPIELTELLDKMVAEYNEEQLAKSSNPEEVEELMRISKDEKHNNYNSDADLIRNSAVVKDIKTPAPTTTPAPKNTYADPISIIEEEEEEEVVVDVETDDFDSLPQSSGKFVKDNETVITRNRNIINDNIPDIEEAEDDDLI